MRKITPELLKAVKKTIRPGLHYEALEILFLTTEGERSDFMAAYERDKGNVCCLVLDYAKARLVQRKILEQKETDGFGNFPI